MSGNVSQIVKTEIIKPSYPTQIIAPIDIRYHVITRDNIEEKLSLNNVYVALNWEDYLRMSQFERDKLGYVEQLHLVIKYYETVNDKLNADN